MPIKSVNAGLVLGVGIIVALLLGNAAITYRNTKRVSEEAAWVTRAQEVRSLTSKLMLNQVDAETGQRGFIITGMDEFLKPYNVAMAQFDRRMAQLKETAEARQQERIRTIEKMLVENLALLKQGIDLRRAGGKQAQAFIASGQGKEEMDAIRQVIGEMEASETNYLKEREVLADNAYRTAVATGALTTVLGLCAIAGLVLLLQRNLRIRAKSVAAIAKERENLRVAEKALTEQVTLLSLSAEVGLALTEGASPSETLQRCADALVRHLDGAFARIWILNPQDNVLELKASAGLYTHLDGAHARVPVGKLKIGLIAEERKPHLTNAVVGDPRVPEQEWAKREGMVAFAGYPLIVDERVVGVIALFARHPLTALTLKSLGAVANQIALGIERKRAEEALVQDVAERKRAEEGLLEADRRKNEFLAMLAHELRNPLAPIRNALQIIRMSKHDPSPEVQYAYGIFDRQVQTLVRLVDDLLDVSRITSGKIQLEKQTIDLADIVARAVEGARPLIDARRHTLEVDSGTTPVLVNVDPVRMAQVLWNILNNAAKYTPEGGKITLQIETGQEAVVRIRDTGMGISPHMLPKVFDLFTQMERTLDRADGGLGIGLTLVRRLTELHGGTVQAFSDGPGRGSEFVLRLPLATVSMAEPATPSAVSGPLAQPSGRRILVVDDNQDSAQSLALLLRHFGNEVRTANDGERALKEAADFSPDVVLLDIGLPGMNGFDVCRHLREQSRQDGPLIVAITGYGQEEDRRLSREAGFDAHLVKPLDLDELRELLARPKQ